ncbi:MAG TPA: SDR family oxidoreductase [Nannocystaceae bacterium]|nr:SDR family oxidoreductase [Nannocystaceae bacterium]
MARELKPIEEQVMVITGASSGIGLATALAAANKGAQLVIAARSGDALVEIAARLTSKGADVIAVTCDVANRADHEKVAETAIKTFGRIDTWVNNAGVGMYGRLDVTDEADARRLFDINFWGVVHGSMVALPYLRASRGVLINVGSEVSEAVAPLFGIYNASKHAVKGFTDTLRLELEQVDDAELTITLVEPTAVDTPFPQHACNYMDQEPKLPGSPIPPEQVAEAILEAATEPTRVARVGARSTINTVTAKIAPRLADKMAAKVVGELHYDEPPRRPEGVLYQPSGAGNVVGQTHGTGGREVA